MRSHIRALSASAAGINARGDEQILLRRLTEAAIAVPVSLRLDAADEQEQRRIVDPLEELIEAALQKLAESGCDKIASSELLAKVMLKDQVGSSGADLQRIARAIQRIPGWTARKIRVEGRSVNGYVRACGCGHDADFHTYGKCMAKGCDCGRKK